LSRRPVSINCLPNRVQQILVTERLGEKLDCAGFHCLYGHGNVPMPGYEDYWQVNFLLGEFALEIEAAMSGQADIKDYAAGNIGQLTLEKLTSRAERLDGEAHSHKQLLDGGTQSRVVVDHKDYLIHFSLQINFRDWSAE